MRKLQAFTHIEVVVAVGLASATLAVLNRQATPNELSQQDRDLHQASICQPLAIDDFRLGDTVESVKRRLAVLGHVKEVHGSPPTTAFVSVRATDQKVEASFRNDRLVWAWETASTAGAGCQPSLLTRVLDINSLDRDPDRETESHP